MNLDDELWDEIPTTGAPIFPSPAPSWCSTNLRLLSWAGFGFAVAVLAVVFAFWK